MLHWLAQMEISHPVFSPIHPPPAPVKHASKSRSYCPSLLRSLMFWKHPSREQGELDDRRPANAVEKPSGVNGLLICTVRCCCYQRVASIFFLFWTCLRGGETSVCAMLCNRGGWLMTRGPASPHLIRGMVGHEKMLGRSHEYGQEGGIAGRSHE